MMKRFHYHFEPSFGWMNDPNGLCYYQGQYHIFYQANPYAPHWNTMHWGHAVSQDLIHFQLLPTALLPQETYENSGGCFSGSAAVKDGRLYLFYTGVSHHLGQTQCLAYSDDGVHFTKYSGNPIIGKCPVDSGPPNESANFRDPKVTFMDGHYYMVCGAGRTGKSGCILLFTSDDLLHWDYIGPLYEAPDIGPVPECPDFFKLDGHYVLMYSQMGVREKAAHFMTGCFDGASFKVEASFQMEFGPDFYAPQTFESPKGERLMLGWHYFWGRENPPGSLTGGALTLPRRLTIENGELKSRPYDTVRPLLQETSPFVKVDGHTLTLTDGARLSYTQTVEDPSSVRVLDDEKSTEVFADDGRLNLSLWHDPSVY